MSRKPAQKGKPNHQHQRQQHHDISSVGFDSGSYDGRYYGERRQQGSKHAYTYSRNYEHYPPSSDKKRALPTGPRSLGADTGADTGANANIDYYAEDSMVPPVGKQHSSAAKRYYNNGGGNNAYHDRDYYDSYYGTPYGNEAYDEEYDEEEDVFYQLAKKETMNKSTERKKQKIGRGDPSASKLTPMSVAAKPTIFNYMVKCNVTGQVHERIQQVGEGTYGKVYKGRNVITNELVALKKLRLEAEREGFPITSHREIGLLQSFDHENIVSLYEIMLEKNQVFMVFPYMNHDLSGIMQQHNIQISHGEKKNIFHQLLKGIEYLHSKRVIHRDIKGSNILIDNRGVLKITDFGLARKMKNIDEKLVPPNYTNRVITLWYRPPEILLGSTDYGREIDIWGVGCLLVELFTRRAIFQGTNEIDQLWKIYDIMGTITTENWSNAYKLPWFEIMRPSHRTDSKFHEKFSSILTPECYKLATELLQMNPANRISASEALNHPYFKEDPPMRSLEFLKTVKGEWHEFEAKQKRRMLQKQQQQQQQQQQQD